MLNFAFLNSFYQTGLKNLLDHAVREVQHRDSTGAGGTIGPGDAQWMTAGAGILHEEFHSQAFARSGGTLDMVQLWVNLPAKDKMTTPGYQTLLRQDIPVVDLPEGAGSLRVIAGEYRGRTGPAHTFSPMEVWDLYLQQGRSNSPTFKAGRTAMYSSHTLGTPSDSRVTYRWAHCCGGQTIRAHRASAGVDRPSPFGR